jgi:hypothetical protein
MKYDLFISHAFEDKELFVDRLALALRRDCYRVWYDTFALQPGRSLRRSIDEGLAESAVGVVVLSPNFFKKEWALRELDALVSQETTIGKLVIPIWLNLMRNDIARVAPLLLDRIAINAAKGFDHVLSELEAQINATDKCTEHELDEVIDRFADPGEDTRAFLLRRCLANFSKLVGYGNAYEARIDEIVERCGGTSDEELLAVTNRLMKPWLLNARRQFEIPDHVYLSPPGSITRDDVDDIETRLTEWCMGSLGQYESAELVYDFDEWLDVDYLFVLFGIPNFRVSPTQRELLNQAVINIGARTLGETPQSWDGLYTLVLNKSRRAIDEIPS